MRVVRDVPKYRHRKSFWTFRSLRSIHIAFFIRSFVRYPLAEIDSVYLGTVQVLCRLDNLVIVWRVFLIVYFGNSLQICMKIERSIRSGLRVAHAPQHSPRPLPLLPGSRNSTPPAAHGPGHEILHSTTSNTKSREKPKCLHIITAHLLHIFDDRPCFHLFSITWRANNLISS